MRIACPYCGERSLDEFAFHGDAAPVRPDTASPTEAEDFFRFVYERDNKAGRGDEYWQHVAGCRAWLIVTRNTLTHEILAVAAARDLALEGGAIKESSASAPPENGDAT